MSSNIGTPVPDCHQRAASARERRGALDGLVAARGDGVSSANGEETAYGLDHALNYHKGLPHDLLGRVDGPSYQAMVRALVNNDPGGLETLPLGANRSVTPARLTTTTSPGEPLAYRKLTSPLTGHVYDTQGADAGSLAIGSAPRLDSPELAAEMAELYAMALLRDTPFVDIESGTGANVGAIRSALAGMDFFQAGFMTHDAASARRHASRGTLATPAELFRGSTPGSRHGQWVSQFMLVGNSNGSAAFQPPVTPPSTPSFRGISASVRPEDGFVFFGTQIIDQRSIVAREGIDYMTNWAAWLDAQNGVDFGGLDVFRSRRRFLTTPRDIATYVHYDALYQAYLVACLIMANDGRKFPKDRGLPETKSRTRSAFASFGGPHVLALLTEVSSRALKHVWRQKWLHHRRARPEVVASLITLHANNPSLIADSGLRQAVAGLQAAVPQSILSLVATHNAAQSAASAIKPVAPLPAGFPTLAPNKNYLLPMAFPEGSPTHPAYGAGHATVAGACVTVLKAFFEMFDPDGRTPRAWPLTPLQVDFRPGSGAGTNENEGGELKPIAGASGYTVQGELDKLAMNIGNARNMAGVHYYTDYYESLRLGERVAVSIIEDHLSLYGEPVAMSFTSFDQEHVRIASNGATTHTTVDGASAERWYTRYGT